MPHACRILAPLQYFVILAVCLSFTVQAQNKLTTNDFSFGPPHGSAGASITQEGPAVFRVKLGAAPTRPTWPNKLNCYIKQNAKGVALRLIVQFDSGTRNYAFNEYFQSFSYDRQKWQKVSWHQNRDTSPKLDTLDFPAFEADSVWIGTQIPFSFEDYKTYQAKVREHPHASMTVVGWSQERRPIYRLSFTNPDSKIPENQKWGLYFASQHPGEHNAQRRMIGMIDYLTSDSGKHLLDYTVCHFIIYMSPDAPYHGWYRVVASGEDMNRTFRVAGPNASLQPKEAYALQRDMDNIYGSPSSIDAVWAVHTWPGKVDIGVKNQSAKELSQLGSWQRLAGLIKKFDVRQLIKPVYMAKAEDIDDVMWAGGPGKRYGATAYLCEGGGDIYTDWENQLTGYNIMQAISKYYNKPKAGAATLKVNAPLPGLKKLPAAPLTPAK